MPTPPIYNERGPAWCGRAGGGVRGHEATGADHGRREVPGPLPEITKLLDSGDMSTSTRPIRTRSGSAPTGSAPVSLPVRRLDRVMLGTVSPSSRIAIAYTRITARSARRPTSCRTSTTSTELPSTSGCHRQERPTSAATAVLPARCRRRQAHRGRRAPDPVLSVVLGVLTILTVYWWRAGSSASAVRGSRRRDTGRAPARVQYLAGAINDDNLAWLAGALLVARRRGRAAGRPGSRRARARCGLAVALAVLARRRCGCSRSCCW